MMRKKLKDLLQERGTLCGCFIQIPSPEIVEMARKYDYVILDYEHGHITRDRLVDMIRAAEAVDLAVMVRIPEVDPATINKVLDIGASALLVSSISSAEEARRLAAATHYYPEGTRGACPFTRANYYGSGEAGDSYYEKMNRDIFVAATIEDLNGAREMREIIGTDGIDALGVGIFDLSVAMDIPGQTDSAEVRSVVHGAIEAARACGKLFTTMVMEPDEVRGINTDVCRLIMCGAPELSLQNYLNATAERVHQLLNELPWPQDHLTRRS